MGKQEKHWVSSKDTFTDLHNDSSIPVGRFVTISIQTKCGKLGIPLEILISHSLQYEYISTSQQNETEICKESHFYRYEAVDVIETIQL